MSGTNHQEVLASYYQTYSLTETGRKFGICRERVRQILVEEGIRYSRPLRSSYKAKLKAELSLVKRIERTRTCDKCGGEYLYRRTKRKHPIPLCPTCYPKARNRLNGYISQLRWAKKNPEKAKEISKRATIKYNKTYRKERNRKARERYRKDVVASRARFHDYYWKDPDHARKMHREYYRKNRLKILAQQKANRLKRLQRQ